MASSLLVGLSCGQDPAGHDDVGREAPGFSAWDNKGQSWTLQSLSEGRTLVLVFLKNACKLAPTAIVYFNRIGIGLQGRPKVRCVGVIDDDASGYEWWSQNFRPTFDVLFDPKQDLIRAYQVERSCEVVIVAGGKIVRHDRAFSKQRLTAVVTYVGNQAEVAPESVADIGQAPDSDRYG